MYGRRVRLASDRLTGHAGVLVVVESKWSREVSAREAAGGWRLRGLGAPAESFSSTESFWDIHTCGHASTQILHSSKFCIFHSGMLNVG